MPTETRYAQLRERCQELIKALRIPRACGTEEFTASVGRRAGSKVRLVPLQLPEACTALWLGTTGSDRVGYNGDWPVHEINLTGHAFGHLILGHCGEARDGGQFVCTAGRLGVEDLRTLGRHLHDPAVSRLFSDGEEHAAAVFAHVLAEWLGIRSGQLDAGNVASPAALTCVG